MMPLPPGPSLALAVAGVVAGALGAAGGITSLVSYSALPATGLPPLPATVAPTARLTFEPTRRSTVAAVARYRISQLAELVGVPATTLRYYESQELVPARRTPGGYRSYDDHDVERVRFIVTAKELGLSLAAIRDLLDVWQGGLCRDVRGRLLPQVAARITELDGRIDDLRTLRLHLVDAREHLRALPSRDAPCDPGCSFLGGPAAGPDASPPVACSLPAGEHAARLRAWHAALAGARTVRLDDGAVRAELPVTRAGAVAALVADEVRCCPFLRFTLTVTGDGARLDATASAEARPLLDDLFPAPPTESSPC